MADPRFVDTALTRARYRALALSLVRERDRKRRRGALERAALCVSLGLHLWKNDFQVFAQAAAVSLGRVVVVGHHYDRRTLGTAEQRGLRRGALHEAQGFLVQLLAVQHRRALGDQLEPAVTGGVQLQFRTGSAFE